MFPLFRGSDPSTIPVQSPRLKLANFAVGDVNLEADDISILGISKKNSSWFNRISGDSTKAGGTNTQQEWIGCMIGEERKYDFIVYGTRSGLSRFRGHGA